MSAFCAINEERVSNRLNWTAKMSAVAPFCTSVGYFDQGLFKTEEIAGQDGYEQDLVFQVDCSFLVYQLLYHVKLTMDRS